MVAHKVHYNSPIGLLVITGTEDGISSILFEEEVNGDPKDSGVNGEVCCAPESMPTCLGDCYKQLDEYFEGKRKDFLLKLSLAGTSFQKEVWQQLQEIPYGKTASYKDVAFAINNPQAVRAVGGANNKNPISIVVPCHRVIGANGSLTGYGGGLWRKEWLLQHESKFSGK